MLNSEENEKEKNISKEISSHSVFDTDTEQACVTWKKNFQILRPWDTGTELSGEVVLRVHTPWGNGHPVTEWPASKEEAQSKFVIVPVW